MPRLLFRRRVPPLVRILHWRWPAIWISLDVRVQWRGDDLTDDALAARPTKIKPEIAVPA